MGYPETSAANYQSTLLKIPEQRRSHLHRGGNLKPHNVKFNWNTGVVSPHVVCQGTGTYITFDSNISLRFVCRNQIPLSLNEGRGQAENNLLLDQEMEVSVDKTVYYRNLSSVSVSK